MMCHDEAYLLLPTSLLPGAKKTLSLQRSVPLGPQGAPADFVGSLAVLTQTARVPQILALVVACAALRPRQASGMTPV